MLGSPPSPFILTIGVCDDILVLTSNDLPFQPFYKAGSEIHIQGPITEILGSLTLSAPIIRVIDTSPIYSEAEITIDNNGCMN